MNNYLLMLFCIIHLTTLGMTSRLNLDQQLMAILSSEVYKHSYYTCTNLHCIGYAPVAPDIHAAQDKLTKKMEQDRLNQIRRLLERGASANATDQHGLSALDRAIELADVNLVKLLLDKGATTTEANKYGNTPLEQVLRRDSFEFIQKPQIRFAIIKLLLDKANGLSVSDRVTIDDYIVSNFWSLAYKDIVKLFIKKGSDINTTNGTSNYKKNTALHAVADHGDADTLQFLLQRGADPSLKNGNNQTALDVARFRGYASGDGSPRAKIKVLRNYLDLQQQIYTKPTVDTVYKVIESGYVPLLKQALKKVSLTPKQVIDCLTLTEKKFKNTRDSIYQSMGRLLQEYLLTLKRFSGAQTQSEAQVPLEIAQVLAQETSGYVV